MKDKIFPTLANFEIVESVDDAIKIQIKKYKQFHVPLLSEITGMSQPTLHKALRRLAREGLIIDKGMQTLKFKNEKHSKHIRLYERV